MRVISENSKQEIARQRAQMKLDAALLQLTGNLIRVTRGAGKPDEIVRQATAFADAARVYRETNGDWPLGDDLAGLLDVSLSEDFRDRAGDEILQDARINQEIMRGGLQVAASKLLGQPLQVMAGEREIWDGVQKSLDVQKEREAKQKAEMTAARARPKAKRRH